MVCLCVMFVACVYILYIFLFSRLCDVSGYVRYVCMYLCDMSILCGAFVCKCVVFVYL